MLTQDTNERALSRIRLKFKLIQKEPSLVRVFFVPKNLTKLQRRLQKDTYVQKQKVCVLVC